MKKLFILLICVFLLKVSYGQTITIVPFSGTFCSGVGIEVSYSTTGLFNIGNLFNLKLSDSNGSFSNPVIIGSNMSLNSLISGNIPKIIVESEGYRLRIVSSDPIVISNDNGNNIKLNQTPNLTMTPSIPCQGDDVTFTLSPAANVNFSLLRSDTYMGINNNTVPFSGTSKLIKHQDIYGNEGIYHMYSTQTGCSSEQIALLPMPCHPQVDFVVRDKNLNSNSTPYHYSSTILDMVHDEADNIYVKGVFTDSLIIGQDTIIGILGTNPE